jgi:dihydrofolate synthase / folylpolyglutamate synthase
VTVDGADEEALQRVEAALRARWPESRIAPSLDRIHALMDVLGEPQTAYPVVLVAGTNGKTSTVRMVEAVLRGFGLRTGRYTSPHLESMLERIALDGEPVSAERFVAAYDEIAPYVELVDARNDVPMSFFEVLTGMAYAAFADAPIDVAVVEVGMGGSWDATNVADAQVPVVMPIALDHTDYLGSTVDDIAVEKAGIVKHDSLAVLAQQQSLNAAEAVLRRTIDVGATVAREGIEFGLLRRDVAVGGQMLDLQGLGGNYEEVFLPLHGPHQAHNAACALAAAEAFLGGGREQIDIDVVRQAFAAVTSPGRLEVVRRSPTVLLDAAHNPAGAAATTAAIHDAFTFTRLIGVVAILEGKDVRGILEALEPVLAEVVVTQNSSPRTLSVDELAAAAVDVFGIDRVEVIPRIDDALDSAVTLAEEEGDLGGAGVLVTGSIVTVGDARTLLRRDG